MRTFRILLTLLLCLLLPVSGWASVPAGEECAQHDQHGLTHAPQHPHVHAGSHRSTSTGNGMGQQQRMCVGIAGHNTPCNCDSCACGCGTGACTSSALSLLASLPSVFVPFAGKQALPRRDEPLVAGIRGSSPLRPPIS